VRILDPYAVPGTYRKAQLHCHTRRSDGRFEPADLARRYRDAGYAFVCFTDHDRPTRCDEVSTAEFLALPGVEETIVRGVRPLGPHLGRLLVDQALGVGTAQERIAQTLASGGVPVLHHPSWTGNLWTGSWSRREIEALRGPFLVEIWNPHSGPDEDRRRWAAAVRAHGPGVRITGVAGDDCHVEAQFNRAWVMVKVPAVSSAALRDALLQGAAVATTGVAAEFGVRDGGIIAESDGDEVLVFDAHDRIRQVLPAVGHYAPAGDEGFVRLECRAGARRAWSQAFWIATDGGSLPPRRTDQQEDD
jgi:hypothetical protein